MTITVSYQWAEYRKMLPGAVIYAVDRHGASALFTGAVWFNSVAGNWVTRDDTVKKLSMGLTHTYVTKFDVNQAIQFAEDCPADVINDVKSFMKVAEARLREEQFNGLSPESQRRARPDQKFQVGLGGPDFSPALPPTTSVSVQPEAPKPIVTVVAPPVGVIDNSPAMTATQVNPARASILMQLKSQVAVLQETIAKLEQL